MAGETPMDVVSEEAQKQHLDWNVDMEVQLFYAMRGHKPVGVNRHFQMVCIHEKFKNSVQMDVTSQQIWDHLDTMYDMAALHESEIVPFPNDVTDFALPDTEFGKQIGERLHAGPADKSIRDDVTGRTSKESDTVDDKGDAAKLASGGAHQASKQVPTKKDRHQKETRTGSASTPTTPTPPTPTASEADGSADAGSQQKRKRNTRLQLEQQSALKPSSPASSSSVTPSSTKGRRRP